MSEQIRATGPEAPEDPRVQLAKLDALIADSEIAWRTANSDVFDLDIRINRRRGEAHALRVKIAEAQSQRAALVQAINNGGRR